MDATEEIMAAIVTGYGVAPPHRPPPRLEIACRHAATELGRCGYTAAEVSLLVALVRARDPGAPPGALGGYVWLLADDEWGPMPPFRRLSDAERDAAEARATADYAAWKAASRAEMARRRELAQRQPTEPAPAGVS